MAGSLNKCFLMGNLTRDPEVKHIPNGTATCTLGLAVNRTWFDKASNQKKEAVTFVDVQCWAREAEIAGEYLAKGRQVLIEGRLDLDTWQDKESGQQRQKLKVTCEHLTLIGGKQDGNSGGQRSSGGSRNQQGRQQSGGNGNYFGSGSDQADEAPF